MAALPLPAANIKAVQPNLSLALMLAHLSTKACTVSMWSYDAANIKGVWSTVSSFASTSAPVSSRVLIVAVSPSAAAFISIESISFLREMENQTPTNIFLA
jgi:hypothetical protein